MERLTPKLWISCAQRPNVSETSNMKDMGQHVDEKQKESYVSPAREQHVFGNLTQVTEKGRSTSRQNLA